MPLTTCYQDEPTDADLMSILRVDRSQVDQWDTERQTVWDDEADLTVYLRSLAYGDDW
jgi:hypothetical protein